MQITDYVKPELVVVALVLYLLGVAIKKSQLLDSKYIPLINGGAGILICTLYVFATCSCNLGEAKDIAMAAFTAITQGVLVAGLSTYVHQTVKQIKNKE